MKSSGHMMSTRCPSLNQPHSSPSQFRLAGHVPGITSMDEEKLGSLGGYPREGSCFLECMYRVHTVRYYYYRTVLVLVGSR